MSDEAAKKTALDNHLKENWRTAHNIWENIQKALTSLWTRTMASFDPANDAAWHDRVVSGAPTGSDKIVLVYLCVSAISGAHVNVRKNGSGADAEGIVGEHGGNVWVECDSSATYEYWASISYNTTILEVGFVTVPKLT